MRDILLDIPYDNPFENDQFEREIIAENFMKIFDADEEGLVLAIDSDWGTGKTTFIKMWETLINNDDRYKDNYYPIYFNAWDNDYLEDPLLAILTEMKLKEKREEEQVNLAPEIFKEIFNPIYLVAKRGVDIVLKLGTGGAIGIDELKIEEDDTQEKILEKMNQIGNEVLNRCANARMLRDEFKEKLGKFSDEYNKKLIFFIDELDRCRPSFAIELLETIKHLFSVPGVIFVISLDKSQLSHSVATIYGEKMDTTGYLRRFFDLDYKLPNPNKIKYIEIKLENIFRNYSNSSCFKQFLEAFILEYNFSLRDIDKLCYYLKIVLPIIDEFKRNDFAKDMKMSVISYIYAYLISIKIKQPTLYKKIMDGDYERNIEFIRDIFNLDKLSSMELNINNEGVITNDEILDELKSKAIENYLVLNSITKTKPSDLYKIEDDTYVIKIKGYNYGYNMIQLFNYNGECRINTNLEFMNRLKK